MLLRLRFWLATLALVTLTGAHVESAQLRERGSSRIQLSRSSMLASVSNIGPFATPQSFAISDFDRDGSPDIAVGYETLKGGAIVLYRGESTIASFRPDSEVFETAMSPQFLAAGDFDADGQSDLLAAERRGRTLAYLPGDGKGRFGEVIEVRLPGALTALLAHEANRPDGIIDVIAAISDGRAPKLLVFEGPSGARHAVPEVLSLPSNGTAIAAANFDDDFNVDIVVAAGRNLVFARGRDRMLSLGELAQRQPSPPLVAAAELPFDIRSMAAGEFSTESRQQLAILSDTGTVHFFEPSIDRLADSEKSAIAMPMTSPLAATTGMPLLIAGKLSNGSGDDVIALDPAGQKIHMVRAGSKNFAADSGALDTETPIMAALTVRLAGGTNALVALERGKSVPTVFQITTSSILTVINTNGSGPGSLLQAVEDANATTSLATITFNIPGTGPFTINVPGVRLTSEFPVTIDGTTQPGYVNRPLIEIVGRVHLLGGDSILRGLSIHSPGVDSFGTFGEAVILGREPGSTIQPTNGNNTVVGCYIGLLPDGVTAGPTVRQGIWVASPNNIIGGTTAAARNVIAGNRQEGILITPTSGVSPDGNIIQGNYIGTKADGTAAVPNQEGIRISGASNNIVGGTLPGAGNLISGNGGAGIRIDPRAGVGVSNNNVVQGNLIGTNRTGTAAISNGLDGVILRPGDFPSQEAANNLIGGTTPAARNVISGNLEGGIWIGYGNPVSNLIQGNFIGTQIDGVSALGNGASPPPGSNHNDGIFFEGPGAGTPTSGPSGNSVGGAVAGSGNVIAFSSGSGVHVSEAYNNVIAGNSIFSNARAGVMLGFLARRTNISRNSIDNNTDLGIDILGIGPSTGPTANDHCDGDSGLGNDRQNFPALTSAMSGASSTRVTGTLDSVPNATFTLEFFSSPAGDPSGFGEGRTFLGSGTMTTNSSCIADFGNGFTLPVPAPVGSVVTATATDANGSTSELSQWVAVAAAPAADLSVSKTATPSSVVAGATITYTITVTNNGPSAASNVALNDAVPSNTTFESMIAPAGWNCATPAAGGVGNITCSIPSLASGVAAFFSIVARVDAAAMAASITNTASVSGTVTDPNSSNDSATVLTSIVMPPDVYISKVAPATVVTGGSIAYAITLTNSGGAAAQNVSFTDPLPVNTSFLAETQNSGVAFTCVNPAVGASGSVTCSVSSFAGGASASFTIVVQANAAAGTIVNTATIAGGRSATANTDVVPPVVSPLGPIYTQGASYRIDTGPQPLGPIYTQGASYRIDNGPQPLGPVYTQGASYRINNGPQPLGPIYTQGASYIIVPCAANVSTQITITRGGFQLNRTTGRYVQQVTLKNSSATVIQGPVSLALDNLSSNAGLFNRTGTTSCAPSGNPHINVSVGSDNVLTAGESASVVLEFTNPSNQSITYSTRVLDGTGAK